VRQTLEERMLLGPSPKSPEEVSEFEAYLTFNQVLIEKVVRESIEECMNEWFQARAAVVDLLKQSNKG